MENYIKYQRFIKECGTNEEIQSFLDEFVTNGWEIISYKEEKKIIIVPLGNTGTTTAETIEISVLAGKKSSQIKNVL